MLADTWGLWLILSLASGLVAGVLTIRVVVKTAKEIPSAAKDVADGFSDGEEPLKSGLEGVGKGAGKFFGAFFRASWPVLIVGFFSLLTFGMAIVGLISRLAGLK